MLWGDLTVLSNVGGWMAAIGTIFYYNRLLARGRLVPERIHKETVAERDMWKQAAQTALDTNAKQAGLMEDVRLVLRTNASLVRAAVAEPEPATNGQ